MNNTVTFEQIDQSPMTRRQYSIMAAILADMLEFFDFFLLGFILSFIVGPWELTYNQTAFLLLTSGVGAIVGGFAIVGPYAAEVWPTDLRTSGMGSAYGFGGLGKILGPVGLALIAGSSQIVNPEATIASLTPGFVFLACFAALAGFVYLVLGIETRGKSIEEIDAELQVKGRQLSIS